MAENVANEEKKEEPAPKKMGKAEFWIRFVLWIAFAIVAPVAYIAIAYGLFAPQEANSSGSIALSGWGVTALIFVAIMILFVINSVKKSLPYASMARQCLDGIFFLVPLLVVILILHVVKGNIDQFENFLIFTFFAELIAVPINPMRKWGEENHAERRANILKETISKLINK